MVTILLLGLVVKPPNSSSLQKREVIQIGPLTFASLLQRWRLKKVILLISLATTES